MSERNSTSHAAPQPRTPRLGFSGVPKRWFGGQRRGDARRERREPPLSRRASASSCAACVTTSTQLEGSARWSPRSAASSARKAATRKRTSGSSTRCASRATTSTRPEAVRGPRVRSDREDVDARAAPRGDRGARALHGHPRRGRARRPAISAAAHPVMRQLLEWHALEELEHKAVAFDVLRAVNPSYALRITGMALGSARPRRILGARRRARSSRKTA